MKPPKTLQDEIKQLAGRMINGVVQEAAPIELKGGKNAVLLLHGFTSSPKDFNDVATALNKKGFSVYVPLLPGHGTSPKDLEKIKYTQWIQAAEKAYDKLAALYDKIITGGFSMGGILALHLAAKKKVEKLFLLAPLIKLHDGRLPVSSEFLAKSVGRLMHYQRKTKPGNINDPEGIENHFAYFHYPLSAVRQALKLPEMIKPEIPKVQCPLLIIHATGDETVDITGSEWLIDAVSSKKKELVKLEKSNHVVTRDYEKDIVLEKTVSFVSG